MDGKNAPLYRISAELLDGQRLSLSHFAGRVLLIVNTASKCGFTPQYGALESLYREYNSRGFAVSAAMRRERIR